MLLIQYKFVLVVQNNQHLNLFSTNTVCVLKAIPVVCINPSDACQYLADSYRPYQDRNNKLAATFDGAHGQAAQVQMGLRALHNATAENASPLAVAGRFVAGCLGMSGVV